MLMIGYIIPALLLVYLDIPYLSIGRTAIQNRALSASAPTMRLPRDEQAMSVE